MHAVMHALSRRARVRVDRAPLACTHSIRAPHLPCVVGPSPSENPPASAHPPPRSSRRPASSKFNRPLLLILRVVVASRTVSVHESFDGLVASIMAGFTARGIRVAFTREGAAGVEGAEYEEFFWWCFALGDSRVGAACAGCDSGAGWGAGVLAEEGACAAALCDGGQVAGYGFADRHGYLR
jgi:hypothetical protein